MRYNRFSLAALAAVFSVWLSFPLLMPNAGSRQNGGLPTPGDRIHSDNAGQGLDRSPGLHRESEKPGHSLLSRMPIAFEMNEGQAAPGVKFTARGRGYWLGLTSSEAVFKLAGSSRPSSQLDVQNYQANSPCEKTESTSIPVERALLRTLFAGRSRSSIFSELHSPPGTYDLRPTTSSASQTAVDDLPPTIRMKLVGARSSAPAEGVNRLPGVTNYFLGNDPKRWRRNVSNYSKVVFHDVYPGIDLVYYGKGQQLEFDFIVSPGGNPDSIQLAFEGIESLCLSPEGDQASYLPSGGRQRRRDRRPLRFIRFATSTIRACWIQPRYGSGD
jgi:hypothetical protein